MLGILVKKQLAEVFRTYFYNEKKKKARSKIGIIGWFLFFVVIMVGVLGGMFTMLSYVMAGPMIEAGVGWLYLALMGLLAVLLGVFGSVFNTYGSLYMAKDNDQLLAMPIPNRYIITARLMNVYLMGLLYSAVVVVPAVIVYWIEAGISLPVVVGGLVLILVVSLMDLVLSCVLGWVVARISVKLKHRSYITVIISLAFIGGYYFFYFKAADLLKELIENALVYGEKIKGAAYGMYLFGCIGEGDWVAMAIFTVIMAAAALICGIVLSRTFLSMATTADAGVKTKYREKLARQSTVSGALLRKEFGRFTASASYMLNCGLGALMTLLMAGFMLIKADMVREMFVIIPQEYQSILPVVFSTVIALCASMSDVCAPSVSLEGKNIWIPQSLPVTAWQVLCAKMKVQLILTLPTVLLAGISAAVLMKGSPLSTALFFLVSILFTVLMTLVDMSAGIRFANLTWTNEITPVKQGLAVFIALFGGWILAAVYGGVLILIDWKIGIISADLYMLAAAAVMLLAILALGRWLKTRGTQLFEEL
ncbi:MAG: hypothetical protein Q4B59_00400 [Lachnospiraceae bacterium]|nr:hypothetical protein [Lachnospiraceae bacterium]